MTLGDRIAVMRDGRLQQCGTPGEVYHTPANRFVAGFIGTPSMNFIEGVWREDAAAGSWLESASLRLPVDKDRARGVYLTPGEKVVLGIRPDNLRLRPTDNDARCSSSIAGMVEIVEPLGSAMDLHVRIDGGQRLVCRVPAESIDADTSVTLHVNPAEIHLFAGSDTV